MHRVTSEQSFQTFHAPLFDQFAEAILRKLITEIAKSDHRGDALALK
jgi:hypothetical protein